MGLTLIRNGQVVDGTGHPAVSADVVLSDEVVADILPRGDNAASYRIEAFDTVVEAADCWVTPGFIDAHSHSDTYLLLEPEAPSKLAQGITTEINGQCGGSAVPRYGAARLSSDWASMRYPSLPEGKLSSAIGPTWQSLADYRALFDCVKPAINTVQFIGHNTLRSSVIGYAAVAATPETLKAMAELLARELDAGGWGLTTGLIYQPGKYSNAAEVTALARVAAAQGGFYATHMRSEGERILEAIDEVLELVKATGIRAEISHLKTSGRANWGKIDAVLDKMQGAVDQGFLLGSDRYPYCAAGTDLDVVFPDWAGVGGCPAECDLLADPVRRVQLVAEINASARDWSTVRIGGTWSEKTKICSGKSIAEICAQGLPLNEFPQGLTPGEVVCRILAADACRTGAFFFGMSEANLQKILACPWVVPGSDASLRAPWGPLGRDWPHPRAYGTMPRFFRLLTGRLAEHSQICSGEEAVARMTSIPARRFGLRGRGVLTKGAFADVAVWNPEEFCEQATYETPHAFARGMRAVWVNGRMAYRAGEFLHAGGGRFLERTR